MRRIHDFTIFIITLLLYSNIILYFYQIGKISLPPFIFYTLSVIILLINTIIINKSEFIIHPIIKYLLLLIGIISLLFIFKKQTIIGISTYFTNIYLYAFTISLLFVFSSSPKSIIISRYAILFSGIISVFVNIYDFLHPFAMLPLELSIPGRAAGFYVNPNGSGIALVLCFLLTIDLVPKRYREVFAILITLGVVLTFSRGAILALASVFLVSLIYKRLSIRKFSIAFALVITIVPLAATTMLNFATESREFSIENIAGRLNWFTSLGHKKDYSEMERLKVANKAIETLDENPLSGVGTSSIWSWQVLPHNMYLLYAVEYGLFGWIIYPLFLMSCVAWGWRKNKEIYIPFIGVMLLFGLVSHNMMDTYSVLIAVAIIAALGTLSVRDASNSGAKAQALNQSAKTPAAN